MNGHYPLPEGWRWERLGAVCTFEYGSGLPERDRLGGNAPVFGSNGIVGYHDVAITQGPTIIVGRKGSIGQVHYSAEPVWPIDTTYYIDSSKTSCDLFWLYWALKSLRLGILNKATGVPGLNREDAYDQLISIPPLHIQKRIAAKIQDLMQEVERALSACEKQLEAAKALPAAYLREVFESEEAKEWERKSLADIGPMTDGDWILNADYAPSGVRLLQVADVGVGRFVDKSSRFITMERARQLNCTFLQPGDILISRMPDPVGRACQLPNLGYPCITAVDVSIWRPQPEIADRQFVTNYLNSPKWFGRVTTQLSGATRPRISRANLEKMAIRLPPLQTQQRIAADLEEKKGHANGLVIALQKQLETINALPQVILRKAFSGEL